MYKHPKKIPGGGANIFNSRRHPPPRPPPSMHSSSTYPSPSALLSAHKLELAGGVEEVIGVGLGGEGAALGFLDEVLVPLLLGEGDGVLLGLELQLRPLHHVARRLPPHQRVLPPVALLQRVPVHPPVVRAPGSGLCCWFGGLIDPV